MTWKTITVLGFIASSLVGAANTCNAKPIVPSDAAFNEDYFLTVLTSSASTPWSLYQYYPDWNFGFLYYDQNRNDVTFFGGLIEVNPFPVTNLRVANILYDYEDGAFTGVEFHINTP